MANRGFDIRKLTGFSSIAMACFFMLYMPIILRRHLAGPSAACRSYAQGIAEYGGRVS